MSISEILIENDNSNQEGDSNSGDKGSDVLSGLEVVSEETEFNTRNDGEIIGGLEDPTSGISPKQDEEVLPPEEEMFNRVRRIAAMFHDQDKGREADELHTLLQQGSKVSEIKENHPELYAWYISRSW